MEEKEVFDGGRDGAGEAVVFDVEAGDAVVWVAAVDALPGAAAGGVRDPGGEVGLVVEVGFDGEEGFLVFGVAVLSVDE